MPNCIVCGDFINTTAPVQKCALHRRGENVNAFDPFDSENTLRAGLAAGYFVGLTVDGSDGPDPDASVFIGDGVYPPFVVFDAGRQDNLPGYYETRGAAEAALVHIRLQEED